MTYDNNNGAKISYKMCEEGTVYETPTTNTPAVETFTINAHYGNLFSPVTLAFTTPDKDPSCAAYVAAGFTCPIMGSYACSSCAATCAAYC